MGPASAEGGSGEDAAVIVGWDELTRAVELIRDLLAQAGARAAEMERIMRAWIGGRA